MMLSIFWAQQENEGLVQVFFMTDSWTDLSD